MVVFVPRPGGGSVILYAVPVSTYSAKARIHPLVKQVTDEIRQATLDWMAAG